VVEGGVALGGSSIHDPSRAGTVVDHIPGDYFGVGFLVKNRSTTPVTITRISAADSGPRFVRLVGVNLSTYPNACPTDGSCPAQPSPLGGPPYRELPPFTPLTLRPGEMAAVAQHFRSLPCSSAPQKAAETDNRLLRIDYRVDDRSATQLLRTGAARLLVGSAACA
jgi:hypothetical protein